MQNRTLDGHILGVTITHLGFLGTRHTALVSADDRGMAFSHLATRGTGALGRTVKTTRLLGRYPDSRPPSGKPLKPSTVLAFSSLPLGNTEMSTDTLGLTAMLTPYLLVIVSTTPIAQTQHKSARPKDVAAHSTMTGCLAWFPAVKLKVPDPATGTPISKVKLVYCWSNVLTVLDVDEIASEDGNKPPSLRFKARSRWTCEEAIVAVQWLSRSVLTVLTVSQRLIVLEDRSMRMTEAFDLLPKHIYHVDLFSRQLHSLVEQLDEDDTSMHGVVADAFYMSLKTYKGRMFLMGFNDISIGALSNWADRLIALMENGDYSGAIQLATSYYTGDANKLTVGLPEDTSLRQSMVRDKLMEIMSASLKYAFGQRQKSRSTADDKHLQRLAEICFTACQGVGDVDFLFDDMYEWYEDAGVEGIFLETLEPYILEKTVVAVPPTVVKAMVAHYVGKGLESRLEEMICHMNTATLDLDQITLLCKQHGLYDALIYVWNQALSDFVTPLIDLMALLIPLVQQDGGHPGTTTSTTPGNVVADDIYGVNALKMFPYLSYILTGRVYPTGERIEDGLASQAKAEIYWFLFSGRSVTWPKGSNKRFLTMPGQSQEPSFPYLRMILRFDAPSFLSSLHEAFEDPFLNDSPEKQLNGGSRMDLPEEQVFGLTVDRQYIVSILTEIMNPSDFAPEDTVYLDMFIARNLPKYPQYLLLAGSTLTNVLTGLCSYPGEDLAEDAQLSAEYLLSVYRPADVSALVPLFERAGFYRILKRTYRVDRQFGKLVQTYFEDPDDKEGIFDCIEECLRPQARLARRQVQDVHQVLKDHARGLVELDPARAATVLDRTAPELHRHVLGSLEDAPQLQHLYLRAILEPDTETAEEPHARTDRELVEQYLRLMCRFDPAHVSDYVGVVQSADLRLDRLLPTMEETGVIDAAIVLMARDGQIQEAMDRLIRHLHTLESALHGLLTGAETGLVEEADEQDAAEELLRALQKYTYVGIWLCQGRRKTPEKANGVKQRQKRTESGGDLSLDESLWLDLIDASVQITRNLSSVIRPLAIPAGEHVNGQKASPREREADVDSEKLLVLLRSLVQHSFTALLAATSAQTAAPHQPGPRGVVASASAGTTPAVVSSANLSFLRILRAFLARAAAASPNLAELRAVLSSIFAAYAYEESILRLSGRLLERSLFVSVKRSVELRQRGWRPKGSTCEACGRRAWGPGVAGNIFEAWEERRAAERARRAERKKGPGVAAGGDDRGKRKEDSTVAIAAGDAPAASSSKGRGKGQDGDDASPTNGGSDAAGQQQQDSPDGQDDQDGQDGDTAQAQSKDKPPGPLVVLACRHMYHQSCLDALQARMEQNGAAPGRQHVDDYGRGREYKCPIDGW